MKRQIVYPKDLYQIKREVNNNFGDYCTRIIINNIKPIKNLLDDANTEIIFKVDEIEDKYSRVVFDIQYEKEIKADLLLDLSLITPLETIVTFLNNIKCNKLTLDINNCKELHFICQNWEINKFVVDGKNRFINKVNFNLYSAKTIEFKDWQWILFTGFYVWDCEEVLFNNCYVGLNNDVFAFGREHRSELEWIEDSSEATIDEYEKQELEWWSLMSLEKKKYWFLKYLKSNPKYIDTLFFVPNVKKISFKKENNEYWSGLELVLHELFKNLHFSDNSPFNESLMLYFQKLKTIINPECVIEMDDIKKNIILTKNQYLWKELVERIFNLFCNKIKDNLMESDDLIKIKQLRVVNRYKTQEQQIIKDTVNKILDKIIEKRG